MVGAVVLGAAAVSLAAGLDAARLVARAPRRRPRAVRRATGLCVGCELYRLGARLRGVRAHSSTGSTSRERRRGRAADDLVVQFTHPLCTDCRELEQSARATRAAASSPSTSRSVRSSHASTASRSCRPRSRSAGRRHGQPAARRVGSVSGRGARWARAAVPALRARANRFVYEKNGRRDRRHASPARRCCCSDDDGPPEREEAHDAAPLPRDGDGARPRRLERRLADRIPPGSLNLEASPDVEAQVKKERRPMRARARVRRGACAPLAPARRDVRPVREPTSGGRVGRSRSSSSSRAARSSVRVRRA